MSRRKPLPLHSHRPNPVTAPKSRHQASSTTPSPSSTPSSPVSLPAPPMHPPMLTPRKASVTPRTRTPTRTPASSSASAGCLTPWARPTRPTSSAPSPLMASTTTRSRSAFVSARYVYLCAHSLRLPNSPYRETASPSRARTPGPGRRSPHAEVAHPSQRTRSTGFTTTRVSRGHGLPTLFLPRPCLRPSPHHYPSGTINPAALLAPPASNPPTADPSAQAALSAIILASRTLSRTHIFSLYCPLLMPHPL